MKKNKVSDGVTVQARLPMPMVEALDWACVNNVMTRSDAIREALDAWLKVDGPQNEAGAPLTENSPE